MTTSTPPSRSSLELSPNDLSIVLNEVTSMSPSNVVNFGLQLNITRNVIKGFEICHNRDMNQCLRELLDNRLKREPPLTWPNIVTALRADCVGESRLAREIEARHMPSSQPPPLLPPQPERAKASLTPHHQILVSPQPSVQPVPAVSDREAVINRHTSHLTETFGNDLQAFSGRFVECGFISSTAANEISSKLGIGNQQKGSELLNLVIANCRVTRDSRKWFNTFLNVLSSERAYEELSSIIREEFMALQPPPQYHTQLAPSYHPQVNLPQYSSPSHRYPPRLAPVNKATHSGSQVEPTAEPPTAKRPRPQPPANKATQSRYHIQAVAEPSVTKRVRLQTPVAQPQAPNTSVSDQTSLFRKFITFVKNRYKGYKVERDPTALKWPPTPSRVYINLACIDRKESGLMSVYDKITEAMVRDGNVDVVRGGKFPIDMNEIAKGLPSNTLETVILVEGAPGVGKSTFAWEYCRRWERGEIAQQYQLVLLLRLRDDRTSRAKTLRDLIQHSSEKVPGAVYEELEATGGANTMIILEGFDELPDVCRIMPSIFLELICGEMLQFATVMVTSRPWATRILRERCSHRIFQHIEILGFTRQQISEYIESVLPDSEARRDLETYINRHPRIRAGMYIPLNSAIVVTVYQESQGSGCPMPTTLTELYTALVRTLIVRYLQGQPEYGINSIQRFSDLPPAVYSKFLKLCGVAYNGIVSTSDQVQLVFSERDLPADFDNLGLMDSVTELYVTQGTVSSHNFLHLTFQEFFAAVHISKMSPEQQLEQFQREKKQRQSGGYGGWSSEGRLKVVLRFLAGLNKLNCFSKDAINHLIQTPTRHEREKYHLSCDAEVDIDLVNWMFEAQSDDVIALLLEQKRIEIIIDRYGMLPMDYYSLGYCIAHSQCQWVMRFDEDINEELDEEWVRMLGAGASTSDGGQGGKIVGLGGNDDKVLTEAHRRTKGLLRLSVKCLNMISTEWKSILQLHQLSLYLSVPCDKITWPDLSKLRVLELIIWKSGVMKLDSLLPHLSLESLTITGEYFHAHKLKYEDCVAIEHHLTNTSTLKHISITYCVCSASGLLVLARAIHDHHPTLQEKELEVYISRIEGDDEARDLAQLYNEYPDVVSSADGRVVTGISDAGAVALAQALHHNSTLHVLDLSNNSISDAGAVALAQALHHNSILRRLDLSNNNISDAGAVALAQALHHNSTLTWLPLSNNSISDAGAVALAQALHHNSTLKELDLSNNSISDAGAVALAQALHHNSTLKELDLSNNSISDAGAVALAQALHHNSTLWRLNLSNNNISDAGAVALAQALHHNSTLTWLPLSNNSISDAGAVALAQALHHNSTLEWLHLSNNSISDAGAVALAQALHHNSILWRLDLSNNSISDAGAVALAQALHHNSTLTWLPLSNNSIIDAGAVALAQALHHNSTLRDLELSNNSISDAGAVALAQALHHNSTLWRLDLSNNSIIDAGAVALAQALHHNSTLKELPLSNNSISDAGAVALAQALHHNSTLWRLDLSNNSITDAGAVALAQALHHNSTLSVLDLTGNDGIGEEGTCQLVVALTVNPSIGRSVWGGLALPRKCEEYATQCPQYHTVKHKIKFK